MRATLALMLLLAGCSEHWPPLGEGGVAETRWPAALLDPAAPEALTARMRCVMARFDETEAAARRAGTHSGGAALLELAADRARREYAGHLYRDAAVTLDRLAVDIDQLRAELGLSVREGCA